MGNLVSRLLCGARSDERASRAEGGIAPGSHGRRGQWRRWVPQWRVSPRREFPLLLQLPAAQAGARTASAHRALRPGHHGRLRFLPAHGPDLQRQREVSETHQRLLGRYHPAHRLRRVLADARAGAAHEERHSRGDVGGRLVRCRRPGRPAEAFRLAGEERRQCAGYAGDGPVAPRRMGARPRRHARQSEFQVEHLRVLSGATSSCRSSCRI